MGYAQKTIDGVNGNPDIEVDGMAKAYLGFGFDNYGNYSNSGEGRDGGESSGVTLYDNRVAVRGPDDGDGIHATGWEFIESSADLSTLSGGGQMDFPDATTRPDQTGADFRSFKITLDANNQLTVEMKFGASGSFIEVFTSDLSSYDRPDTFKIGFTGGSTEIHEVRNVGVTMSPWQPDGFEWDDEAGNSNWSSDDNWRDSEGIDGAPTTGADILFGDAP